MPCIRAFLAPIAKNPIYKSIPRSIYDRIQRYVDPFLPRKQVIIGETDQDLCEIVEAVEEEAAGKAHLRVQKVGADSTA
jgi:hypothetical protein